MTGRPVYLCDGVRTPIGRYGGALAGVRTDDLAAAPIRELLRRHPRLSETVGEVVLGCVNQAGEDNRNVARMAALLAGLDASVPAVTINRLCASGLDAVAAGARMIASGEAHVVIAGGVESMSRAPFVIPKARAAYSRHGEIHDTTIGWRFVNPMMQAMYGTDSMPQTAQNVADEHGISREDQDAYSLRSQQRAAAGRSHLLADVIGLDVPTADARTVHVQHDEHPRPDTTAQGLAALRPLFAKGSVTAGNSAGVNDGAAAVVLTDEAGLAALQLRPLVRIMGAASAGVAPRIMGVGPIPAVRALTERIGHAVRDFDVIELNEAFAAQVLACSRAWGLPDDAEHLNPCGGAIALGHPLGMSGARLVLHASRELQRRAGKRALVTMCVGVGQGLAMAMERVT
ncbi:beta-ketoadipyl CoA thiolase [Bordetella genomosp. 7]|uniref:acetyl-CoA C-acyltransferase n=1 Tax=Bordetella genomosp. 7 TaxID=1416805 RepID=UPI000B9E4FDA|nr:acetyl-CoA C-acyltransferase [Bordetella genomosp. 7]OZI17387.1 beta-ketoadipyl CoA thiolase [Bordetella genomosp. 7]